jgi:AraC-like DNA-binding protein
MLQKTTTPTYFQTTFNLAGPPKIEGAVPDLYVGVFGRLISRGNFSIGYAAQRFAVHVIQEGEGVVEVDGYPFPARAGNVFSLFPGHQARYYDRKGSPWRYTWFGLEGPGATRAVAFTGLRPRQPVLTGPFHVLLEPLFREMEKEYRSELTRPLFPTICAWRLVETIASRRSAPPENEPIDLAESARFILDHEYQSPLTLKNVAVRLKVSRFTILRHFRAKYQTSPKQYLDDLRVEQARQLLSHSHSRVKEIADTCGFQSAHYFSRVFRHRFGVSPRQWRKTKQQPAGPRKVARR